MHRNNSHALMYSITCKKSLYLQSTFVTSFLHSEDEGEGVGEDEGWMRMRDRDWVRMRERSG